MTRTFRLLVGTTAVTLFAFAAGVLQAQVTNVLTFSASAALQKNSTDVGGITTTPAPFKERLATKDLLSILAFDEHAAGHLAVTNFPTGSKLVIIDNNAGVVDKTNHFIVAVTNILSATFGVNDITSGKVSDVTDLADKSFTDVELITFTFDDTAIAGSARLKFTLAGVMTSTTTDTLPVAGIYTETQTHKLSSGVGEGTFLGIPFVTTSSSVSASGKGKLSLP